MSTKVLAACLVLAVLPACDRKPEAPATPAKAAQGSPTGRQRSTEPIFAVSVVRPREGRREPDAETTSLVLGLFTEARLTAWSAALPPADLPAGLIEAARAAATAHTAAGGAGDVFIFGEFAPGTASIEFRLVAVDLRSGTEIDNAGNAAPSSVDLLDLFRKTLEEVLGSVSAWKRGFEPGSVPPPPPVPVPVPEPVPEPSEPVSSEPAPTDPPAAESPASEPAPAEPPAGTED
jgi:hypothetical protein